jgi:CHAT domain-containing protein/predicted negative regulator of RcsB-dependent stress response
MLAPLSDTRAADPQVEFDRAKQLFLHGQLENCQQEAERGYEQFKNHNVQWASKFRLLEAEAMVWRGMYRNGLSVLDAEPSTYFSQEDNTERLTLEGVAYTHLQRFSLARERLNEAERLCAPSNGDACEPVLRARGVFAEERGEFDEAHSYFLQNLAFARAHGDRLLESTAYLNLGAISLQESHYDEALDWLKSASVTALALENENLAQVALGNMGWAYFNLGDTERALDLFVEAERAAAKLGNFRYQVKWLTTAGDVHWNTGNFVRASESYSRALALAKQIDSKEDIVNTLEDLAHAAIDAGKLDEANGYLQQLGPLLSANSNRLDDLDVTFARARIAAAKLDAQEAESLFREVEKDPASQISMRFGAEHELARLYESEDKAVDAARMYQTSLATFESARGELKNEESKLPFLANATAIYDDYIHFLVAHHKTDEALELADRSRARTLEQGLGVTSNSPSVSHASFHPGEIARKSNATLLFYWLGERESYLWAITPAKISMFTLPKRGQITPVVERYRKTLLGLSDPVETSNADGVALYRMLLAPARELIRPGSTVVILNDGVLSQLNFETLIAPGPTPHYFIEDATVVSASSLELLASAKPPERTGNKLLLVGDAVSPNPDYPDLPKAASEIGQIEKHFAAPEVTLFARERATAGSYLTSAPQQFAYIHFVAHGVASRIDPLDSAIILSRSTAEADSFKLHARDIMKHPIHARLVTISACYGSGTRSYAGEGLVGLAWAFLRAGAHHVIGALWEVSEESTPRLMDSLYQGLESGKPPAEALRQAKLTLLHSKGEFRKPFFWAPLQIYTGV